MKIEKKYNAIGCEKAEELNKRFNTANNMSNKHTLTCSTPLVHFLFDHIWERNNMLCINVECTLYRYVKCETIHNCIDTNVYIVQRLFGVKSNIEYTIQLHHPCMIFYVRSWYMNGPKSTGHCINLCCVVSLLLNILQCAKAVMSEYNNAAWRFRHFHPPHTATSHHRCTNKFLLLDDQVIPIDSSNTMLQWR